ncbi:MAG TPA: helicase-related protein, partial [Mariprofundaceae bacterium]|nr:helicase-related protein [Mariprofundaceae bacterium]
YASHMKGFNVLPVYGGQSYEIQLKQLARGVHVVVGTPGRVMDHMRRGTLNLDNLQSLVLDEADEMLRMGFIDDVQWILEQTPESRQIALFSATMPPVIRKIAEQHLNDPELVTIKAKTSTVETIRQRYWMVNWQHKMDALTRIMEFEPFDAMIIFVRTRTTTVEVAEKLQAHGFAAQALSGDIQQKQRERIIDLLKKGKLDVIVATDVAARGLDVERITHVINFDIPLDTESYVHRIGRTGRAGRTGDAILFVTPREKNMLFAIERATRQKVELLEMPTTQAINDRRINDFKQRITDTLAAEDMQLFSQIVEEYTQEHNVPAIEVAAALARMAQGDTPLLVKTEPKPRAPERAPRAERPEGGRPEGKQRKAHDFGDTPVAGRGERRPSRNPASDVRLTKPREGMERYRLEVGSMHGAKPGNIVGAIANEAGIDSEFIGHIEIFPDFSTVDLPEAMPKPIFQKLRNVWVAGQQLNLTKVAGGGERPARSGKFAGGKGGHGKEAAGRGAPKGKPAGRAKGKGDAKGRKPALAGKGPKRK